MAASKSNGPAPAPNGYTLVAAIPLPVPAGHGDRVAYDPGNAYIYLSHHGSNVVVVDTKTNKVVANSGSPGLNTPDVMAFDSKYVYVSAEKGGRIAVISTKDWKIVGTARTGPLPDGIWRDQAADRLCVISDGANRLEVYDTGNQPRLPAHVPVWGTGWVASAPIAEADAMGEARRPLYGELATQGTLAALCTGAALVLVHRVALPAGRLAQAARRIAAGDRTARAAPAGRGELAAVCQAFDEMARSLDASWQALRAERDAAEDMAARLATLSRLASLVSSTLDPSQVFDFIAEATSHLLDGAVVLVLVSDAEDGSLSLRASHGVTRPELRAQNRYRPGEGLIGWVLEHREPLVLTDMLQDGRTLNRAWVEAEGLRAFAGVPLVLQDRCLGILYAARSGERLFEMRDVELLRSFAAHAATAIQNARLYKRAEAEAERLRAVLESMPAAVIVGEGRPEDRTIRLVMANRAWAELQGTSALTPGAHTPSYELARADGSPVDDEELPMQRAIWRGEATREEELLLRLPDGRERVLLINAVPFPEIGGTRQAVGMILDITDRRLAEEKLQRLAADNATLYEQAAREARVKGILLEELNHRVRNNLAMMVSFMELQRATPAGRTAAPVLDEAVSRVKGLALIHDVLGGAGFQAGQYEALVYRLAEQTFLRGPLAGRVELRVDKQPLRLPSRALTALGIITNELFTNIAKYAFPDGRKGTVEVTVEAAGAEVVIRIRDDGVRLPSGLSNGAGGLGLRLVRSLVEASLKGTFTLETGDGTTAVIRFPRPEDGTPETDGPSRASGASGEGSGLDVPLRAGQSRGES